MLKDFIKFTSKSLKNFTNRILKPKKESFFSCCGKIEYPIKIKSFKPNLQYYRLIKINLMQLEHLDTKIKKNANENKKSNNKTVNIEKDKDKPYKLKKLENTQKNKKTNIEFSKSKSNFSCINMTEKNENKQEMNNKIFGSISISQIKNEYSRRLDYSYFNYSKFKFSEK